MRRAQFDSTEQPVRNLLTNPSMETAAAGPVLMRTNLALNPRGVTGGFFAGYGAQSYAAATGIPAHPDGVTTATRVSYSAGAGNPGLILCQIPDVSSVHTVSCWVYNEGPTNELIALALKGNSSSVAVDVPPGVWTRLSWTMTTPAALGSGNDYGVRIAAPASTGSFLVTGSLVEKAVSIVGAWFDGASTATDFTYIWTGTANASTSQQRGVLPAAIGISGTSAVTQSSAWSATAGGKSLRITHTPSTTIAEAGLSVNSQQLQAGKTYTVLGTLRIDTVATTTHARSRRFNFYWSTNGGQSFLEANGPQAPNLLGVYPLRYTFTVPADANFTILRAGGQSFGSAGAFQADAWWDNIMLVEGSYEGDYVDGTKPLARWDGTAHASSSVGYPTGLWDIAGKPVFDLTTTGNIAIDLPEKGTFTNTEGRTLYTVHDGLQIPGVAVFPIVTYGVTGLADSPANQTIMMRQQGNTPAVLNRRTGGGGPLVMNLAVVGRNITCWGLQADGTQFIQNNGTSFVTQPTVMDVPHEQMRIHADSTLNGNPSSYHVRTIMYRGAHDAATRTAIQRYLGNKYGAAVA